MKPPRSATIVGTAVARIVASMATRPVVTMIAIRIGPRSDRKPTPLVSVRVELRVGLLGISPQHAAPPEPRLVDVTREYAMTGFTVREHRVEVPVDWSAPDRFGSIEVFARELVDPEKASDDLPLLLFLQGGPGGQGPRPLGGGWVATALEKYRVILLDQRGTGRSSPRGRARDQRRRRPRRLPRVLPRRRDRRRRRAPPVHRLRGPAVGDPRAVVRRVPHADLPVAAPVSADPVLRHRWAAAGHRRRRGRLRGDVPAAGGAQPGARAPAPVGRAAAGRRRGPPVRPAGRPARPGSRSPWSGSSSWGRGWA